MQTKLIYRFTDASVPPQYHRSYLIRVAREMLNLTVDSYGNTLAEFSIPLSDNDFYKFLQALRALQISSVPVQQDSGCTGGVTHHFDIYFDDLIISGYVYACGGNNYGTLEGETDKAVHLFKALIPDLAKKIYQK